MPKWSKVTAGDYVELRDRKYEVLKIKPKGTSAKVTVRGGGAVFESKVALADKVTVVTEPLRDKSGQMQRWAKPSEDKSKSGLPAGDPAAVKPPRKAIGEAWETPRDKVERKLDRILGAHLVGQADDEGSGYYVPPVDGSTVAAHVALFHGVDPSEYGVDDLLELHDNQHAQALAGIALTVNHWHTETRPAVRA